MKRTIRVHRLRRWFSSPRMRRAERAAKQRSPQAALGVGRQGVAGRRARRLHRRQQRRRRPAVRAALGDDAGRRQDASASAATRSRRATRSGRPTASRSRIAAASATRRGWWWRDPDGAGARFIAEMSGTNSSAARQRQDDRVVAGRQADRVRLGDARARRPPTRPAIRWSSRAISTSRRRRGDDALQRQPPPAHLRRRRRRRAASSS